ncbi:hypothetical protein MPER_03737, partial [Moniliophthora perniciosa FA553]
TVIPDLPQLPGSDGVIKNYILPDGKTGVMFVGSFSPDGNTGFDQFQADVVSAINAFKGAGVSRLLIDLTNNGGGFVCLGQFLFQYLAGAKIGYPGFESTSRGNELAQKIVSANIALGLDQTLTFYAPDNCWSFFLVEPWAILLNPALLGAFLNGTVFPPTFDYNDPTAPLTINGRSDPTSQRFHKVPQEPPFDARELRIDVWHV